MRSYDKTLTSHELGLKNDCVKRDCFVCGNYVVFAGGNTVSPEYYDTLEVYHCGTSGVLTLV